MCTILRLHDFNWNELNEPSSGVADVTEVKKLGRVHLIKEWWTSSFSARLPSSNDTAGRPPLGGTAQFQTGTDFFS